MSVFMHRSGGKALNLDSKEDDTQKFKDTVPVYKQISYALGVLAVIGICFSLISNVVS